MLHLLHVLLVLAGHGQTAIGAGGASFETGRLPDLALGRLARRRDVRLRHAHHSRQLPCRLLVQLASRGVEGIRIRLLRMVPVVLRRKVRRRRPLVMVMVMVAASATRSASAVRIFA